MWKNAIHNDFFAQSASSLSFSRVLREAERERVCVYDYMQIDGTEKPASMHSYPHL